MGKNLKDFDDKISHSIYSYGGVQLAFVGDAVFDLYVRNRLLRENPNMNIDKLHKIKSSIVNANFQAKITFAIKDDLSESELDIFKWARNMNGKSAPKSTSASNYRNATGFEALIAALFLDGKEERLDEIMNFAYTLRFENEK